MGSRSASPGLNNLSVALSTLEPKGVVIVSYSRRLSRMFSWDIETDIFTPGQFLKRRAYIDWISSDATFVACHCEDQRQEPWGYTTLSKAPFFTALVYVPTPTYVTNRDVSISNGKLHIERLDWHPNDLTGLRVEPDCPYEVVYSSNPAGYDHVVKPTRGKYGGESDLIHDPHRNRVIQVHGNKLFEIDAQSVIHLVQDFPRPDFEEIVAPDWATSW